MSTNPTVTPTSFSGAIKTFRHRVGSLPLPSQFMALRGAILQLCDDVLVNMGDEYKEDFYSGPLPGSSPSTPLDMSPNVRFTSGITSHVQPTQAPVVMVPGGQEPVAERPSIIARPAGDAPHVQLSQIEQPQLPSTPAPISQTLIVGPGGIAGGGQSASESRTGVTRMVPPGVDPIAAMDDPSLSVPVSP